MGLLADSFRAAITFTGGKLANPQDWLVDLFGGNVLSAAGVKVTHDSAMGLPAFGRGVDLLADIVGYLPFLLMEPTQDGRGKQEAVAHHLYDLLKWQPNHWQTAIDFKRCMMVARVVRGTGYAVKVPTGIRAVAELIPLHPDRCTPYLIDGEFVLQYTMNSGEQVVLLRKDLFILRGPSKNGYTGVSKITQYREALGHALAVDEFGSRFFSNGVTPSGLLSVDGGLSDKAFAQLKSSIKEEHTGLANARKILIGEQGMKWSPMSLSAEDSQFIESRKLSVTDVARMLGVAPHLLFDLDRSTNNNIAEQGLEFAKYTMNPYFVEWEQAGRRDLLSDDDRKAGRTFKVKDQVLQRGDYKTRTEGHKALFYIASKTVNDILRDEDMNPIGPEGDVRFVPVNMIPLDMARELANPEPPDPNAPEDPADDGGGTRTMALRAVKDPTENRRRLRLAHRRLFLHHGERLVSREAKALRAAVEKHLVNRAQKPMAARSLADFETWLSDHYRDFQPIVRGSLAPVVLTLAEAIAPLAAEECGQEWNVEAQPAEFERFLSDYTDALAVRHVESSKGQLRALIAENPAALADTLLARIADWEAKRAIRLADVEAVRVEGAVSRWIFDQARRHSVWVANKADGPLCAALDGKRTDPGEPFAQEGATLEAAGARPLTLRHKLLHAPLLRGCTCIVRAE